VQHVDILSLHRITGGTFAAGTLCGSRGEEADVDVLVLDQLLELWQNLRLDELLALV
jgi:hypothetical protein